MRKVVTGMSRPRHPNKDLEAVLRSLEQQDWSVVRCRKYYKVKCPPPCGQCLKMVKLTPSDPNYARNLRAWLRRSGCWKDDS